MSPKTGNEVGESAVHPRQIEALLRRRAAGWLRGLLPIKQQKIEFVGESTIRRRTFFTPRAQINGHGLGVRKTAYPQNQRHNPNVDKPQPKRSLTEWNSHGKDFHEFIIFWVAAIWSEVYEEK